MKTVSSLRIGRIAQYAALNGLDLKVSVEEARSMFLLLIFVLF